ncbi:medium-chain fatty acid-CoA ligase faa2, partial [Kickxella alabastrina]
MKSYLVPDSAEQGYSAIMRRRGNEDGMFHDPTPHVTTVYELFQHRVNISPNTNLIGSRRFDPLTRKFGAYEWTSAAQAAELVEQFGCGLDHVYQKHAPAAATTGDGSSEQQQALGIYSINRPEWLLAEFAGFR